MQVIWRLKYFGIFFKLGKHFFWGISKYVSEELVTFKSNKKHTALKANYPVNFECNKMLNFSCIRRVWLMITHRFRLGKCSHRVMSGHESVEMAFRMLEGDGMFRFWNLLFSWYVFNVVTFWVSTKEIMWGN